MNKTVSRLIRRLRLKPHPEGGFFRETYRSPGSIPKAALPKAFGGSRSHSTAILFLLPDGTKSRLHRIRSDEVWHFHLGGPLVLTQLSPKGKVTRVTLGTDLEKGHVLQHVVPTRHWFGAYPAKGSGFSLVGCTVAPGFDFRDFELARRERLLKAFPRARRAVGTLT